MEKPQKKKNVLLRRPLISVAILLITVLVLVLGLVFGLRARHHNSSGLDSGSDFAEAWNQPSEFLLSKNFSITRTPTTRYYEWNISQQTIAPDGLERPMLLVNGMFPGPLVEANTGDRIVVKVTNNMVNGTAIHWHGMFQNGTNWMDGSVGITQCPIPPGQSFTYNFTVPNQWGTYWWHSHAASQYIDGIYGPLIIHSPDEPHLAEYQEDVIMMIADHYHTDSGSLVSWYLSPDSEGAEPVPDNGVINGRGTFDCSGDSQALFPTGNKCNNGAPMSVFDFKAGTTYRVRIINSGAFADFQFSIDNHNLTVIEADGVDMQPVQVQRLPIHVAQRYSVLVHANQAVDNYWVRALMNTNCFNTPNPALNPSIQAIIRYEGAASTQAPNSVDWSSSAWVAVCVDLTLDMLKPYTPVPVPAADVSYHIDISFQTISKDHVNMGYMNQTSWRPLMNDSTLFQSQRGISAFDAVSSSQFVIPLNNTNGVQLVLNNLDEGSHPFHFHGHVFHVLGWGHGNYQAGVTPLELVNPLRRDTITIPAYGWTVVRFVNDNPGLWALHCHISWHSESGLMVQFESLPDKIKTMDIPAELKSMCAASMQESKKSSTNKTTPKVMLTKTTKVHKVHKNTTTTKTATAQTDNKPKQKPSKMDIVKAKAAKAKTSATTTTTTQPKCKSEGSSSASASASASASTSDPARKKKGLTKGKQEATGNKKADGIKYQKRTASEVDDSDVENESEAEGQLGNHRPTKTRRIQNDKAEETDVRFTLKRKKAARNDAIWKMITGGVVASSEPSTATTMITSNKTAVTAVSCVEFRVVDEVREVVDQLPIQEGDSENKTGDVTDMNARGGESYDAPTAASTSPRRKTLDVVDDAAFEKLWDVARGKFD